MNFLCFSGPYLELAKIIFKSDCALQLLVLQLGLVLSKNGTFSIIQAFTTARYFTVEIMQCYWILKKSVVYDHRQNGPPGCLLRVPNFSWKKNIQAEQSGVHLPLEWFWTTLSSNLEKDFNFLSWIYGTKASPLCQPFAKGLSASVKMRKAILLPTKYLNTSLP